MDNSKEDLLYLLSKRHVFILSITKDKGFFFMNDYIFFTSLYLFSSNNLRLTYLASLRLPTAILGLYIVHLQN